MFIYLDMIHIRHLFFFFFRSQSVVDPGVLKRIDKNEEENMQPLLSLD